MPTFVRQTRSRPKPQKKNSREIVDEVDKEIDAQQKKSIMKVHIFSTIFCLIFAEKCRLVHNCYTLKYFTGQ